MEKTSSSDTQEFSLYHTNENMTASQELMKTYLSLFSHCKAVLDIGCGPGLFLELLREQNPDRQLTGIDNDPAMVATAKKKGFDSQCISVQEISSIASTFDGIYAGHIIEHLDGNEALGFLKNCYSLLNPGGILLLKTPNWSIPYVQQEGFWLDITHVRPYPAKLLDKIFKDLGLVNVKAFSENTGLRDIVVVGVKELTS